MVFYPDNVKRGSRLQQLVDSMANMQTDIKNDGKAMDAKDKAMRPVVDAMLKENGFDTLDQLFDKATAKMTPDEKKHFEALIASAKAAKAGANWTYFIGGLLMAPEGKAILAIGRFVVRMAAVSGVANLFRAAEGGAAAAVAAAEAAEELEKAAQEAETISREAGVAGEAGTEVSQAAKIMARVSKFVKVLGVIGFVVTVVVAIVELVEGAEQKTKLIDAIHGSQPARLCIAYYKRESTNIIQQLELFSAYMDASYGPDKDPAFAASLSKKIVKNLTQKTAEIDWTALEETLEVEDRGSGSFYGDDDLSKDEVVKRAKESDH